ncbi:MAG: uncharacterized protein JWO31_3840 [Phycisphaerales bacterium]|nr:uncharacterized protein [Phycisphaerales bacterium]
MRKWFKWAFVVIFLLVVAGGVVLFLSLNGIIRGQVEQQSTKSLNLQTALQSASFSPLGGSLSLRDYKVASPPGFSAKPMLELGGLDLKVSYGQLRSDPVRVQAITIDRPKLLLEQVGGRFNIKALSDNLPPPKPGQPSQPSAEGEKLRLIIDSISVKDPTVVIRPGIPGLQEEIPVSVPSFEMKNVGNSDGAQNGAAVKQIVTELVTTLAAKAGEGGGVPAELRALLNGNLSEVAQKYLPGEAGKLVGSLLSGDAMKDPGKALGSALQGVTGGPTTNPADAVKGALDTANQDPKAAAKEAGDALKGVFGGKKKDEKK